MGKWVRVLSSLVGVCALSLFARPASANEPATAGKLQASIGLRYGFELEEFDSNPWGLGLGAEVGYTLPVGAYLGGNLDYFFGESFEGYAGTSEDRLWQTMVEAGFDLALSPELVIRPKLGVGLASTHHEDCSVSFGCLENSSTQWAVAPGAKLVFLTGPVSLSADVRYDMIFLDSMTAEALITGVGVGF
jgi:hypothetical protein